MKAIVNRSKEFIIIQIGKKTFRVKENRIFKTPDLGDDPHICWVWHRLLKPALHIRNELKNKPDLIIMNLHPLKSIKEIEPEMDLIITYFDAVLIEELTHGMTRAERNHENWVDVLFGLVLEHA